MSEYGYIPEAPEQSFGNNKGIFNPKDMYDLTRANKWTDINDWQLITSVDIADGTSYIDLTDIQEGNYRTHVMIGFGFSHNSNKHTYLQLSADGGSNFINTGYHKAINYQNQANNDSGDSRYTNGTSYDYVFDSDNTDSARAGGGYLYMYNLGDSTKSNTAWAQNSASNSNNNQVYRNLGVFGHATTQTINALRLGATGGTTFKTGHISLYGIKGINNG
tara:strand:+ start:415 stop:1071 length:657 start_codon:yes stop_codon:yes gene_type:complete